MKLQEYRQTMDSLGAPHDAAKRVLSQVRESEILINEISIEENKRKINIRWMSAIAAVLVFALALTVIFSVRGNSHTFVLKAGAAEINSDGYVSIGEILPNGSDMGLAFDSYEGEDITDAMALLRYHQMNVDRAFSIDNITYEGGNIEQVTYTIHGGNGYFSHDMETGTTFYIEEGEFGGISGEPENQGFNSLVTDDSDYHLYFVFSDDTGRFSDESYLKDTIEEDENGGVFHHLEADDLRIFAELFEENKQDIYMDVTATFTDGTAATQRLTFDLLENSSDDDATSYILQAKLADNTSK